MLPSAPHQGLEEDAGDQQLIEAVEAVTWQPPPLTEELFEVDLVLELTVAEQQAKLAQPEGEGEQPQELVGAQQQVAEDQEDQGVQETLAAAL